MKSLTLFLFVLAPFVWVAYTIATPLEQRGIHVINPDTVYIQYDTEGVEFGCTVNMRPSMSHQQMISNFNRCLAKHSKMHGVK